MIRIENPNPGPFTPPKRAPLEGAVRNPRARRLPGATALIARLDAADAIGPRDPHARWRVDFPTAVALLEHWDKPWASRLGRFAMTRLVFMCNAGFDVLEVGSLPTSAP